MAHLAASGDLSTYSSFTDMQLLDLIDDVNEISASRQTFINMPSDFPSFRAGGTVWLKNPSEGSRYGHDYTGLGTNWGGGSSGNPVKFKVLDQHFNSKNMEKNTQVYNLQIFDCQYIELDGYHPSYKGMLDPNFGARPGNFFGWRGNKDGQAGNGTNMFAVKGDIKEVSIKNIMVTDGFAKFRLQPDTTSVLDKLEIIGCWGEFGSGEPFYINTTNAIGGGAPVAKNWHMANCVAFMGGAEGLQLQDFMWGSHVSIIENCTLAYNASDWKAPFLSAQGSDLQLRYNEGGIIVRNCILYGWGNNGLNLQFNTKGNPAVNNGQIIFENCLFIDGRNRCALLNTNDHNIPIVFNRCDFGHIEEEYSAIGEAQALEQINVFNLIELTLKNCRYSSSRTFYIEEDTGDGADTRDVANTSVSDATIERPAFINDGVNVNGCRVLNWNWETSDGTAAPGTAIDFEIGDFVRFKVMEEKFTVDTGTNEVIKTGHDYNNGDFLIVDTLSGTLPSPLLGSTIYYVVNKSANRFQLSLTSGGSAIDITTSGSGRFIMYKLANPDYGKTYRSNTNHSSTELTRPDKDTTDWTVNSWDVNNVRDDEGGYAGHDTYEPPKDIRLESGSYHEALGRKRGVDFGPSGYGTYQWQVSTDSGATWENINVPGARRSYFNYSEIGYSITGKSFRRIVVCKNIAEEELSNTGPSADF